MVIITILAILFFLYSLLSHRLERTILTGPMIFTTAGILLFIAMPDQAAGFNNVKTLLRLMEIALAVVLFTDGTRIRVVDIISRLDIPGRLLIIGMPLIILTGTILAKLIFPDFTLIEAAIIGCILAPTDAGLGHAVMSSKQVPLRVRQALNIEAGLNDGLSLPFLMLFIALSRVEQVTTDQSWILYFLQEVGLGAIYGFILGWIGGWLLGQAQKRNWTSPGLEQLALLSFAVLTWAIVDATTGNSFIAAFVSGLVIKQGNESAGEQMVEFSLAWGQLLNLYVFAVFGTLVGPVIEAINLRVIVYAILSLTAVRMVPVGIALLRTRLHRATVLFMGWFGPRGLASIVLGLIFLKQEANLAGEELIAMLTVVTVLISVFVHGISAAPTIGIYAKQVEMMADDAPERQESTIMPVRY